MFKISIYGQEILFFKLSSMLFKTSLKVLASFSAKIMYYCIKIKSANSPNTKQLGK